MPGPRSHGLVAAPDHDEARENLLDAPHLTLRPDENVGRIPSVRMGGPAGPVRFIEHGVDSWIEQADGVGGPRESQLRPLSANVT